MSTKCTVYWAKNSVWYLDAIPDRKDWEGVSYGPFQCVHQAKDFVRNELKVPDSDIIVDHSKSKAKPRRSPNGSPVRRVKSRYGLRFKGGASKWSPIQ